MPHHTLLPIQSSKAGLDDTVSGVTQPFGCAQALTGERVGTKAALLALEALFRSAGQSKQGSAAPMTVVLVDEMDLLVTRNQTVRLLIHSRHLAHKRIFNGVAASAVSKQFSLSERPPVCVLCPWIIHCCSDGKYGYESEDTCVQTHRIPW